MQKPVTTKTLTKSYHSRYLFLAFWGAILLVSMQSKAQGDLLLYPKRIVFEGSIRYQTLNLANSGKDSVRYLISVVQGRMNADGSFETISQPDSGQHFA